MTEQDSMPENSVQATEHDESREGRGRQIPMLVFGLTSLGFLIWIAFGSVEARIWRYNRLYFEDRTIREVWGYFSDRLPEMPGQPVITALFWTSLVVMIVGTVVGLWLFFGTPDEDPARAPVREPGIATSHE